MSHLPRPFIYEDALQLDLSGKTVLIIGQPATGKTHLGLGLYLRNKEHHFLMTDNYMQYGYKEALYVLIQEIQDFLEIGPVIIEGVQGYRLLRKGAEMGCFYPDIVLELQTTPDRIEHTYQKERGGMKKGLVQFNAMHSKILNDYRKLPNPHPPAWYVVQNHYEILTHS